MVKEWGNPLFCLLKGKIKAVSSACKGMLRLLLRDISKGYEVKMKEEIMNEKKDIKPKKRGNTAEAVMELAKPLAEKLNLTLWDVTYAKEGADWYLRVFIDKEGGIFIDDCVDMTHEINPVLDKEDPIGNEYILEVSSPGVNRKLTRPEHFERYIGELLRVKLIRPTEDGKKVLDGELLSIEPNGDFTLQIDEETTATFEKKECSSVVLYEMDF